MRKTGITSISMKPELYQKALKRQHDLKYDNFSQYIKALIETDVELSGPHVRTPNSPEHSLAAQLLDEANEVTQPLPATAAAKVPKRRRRGRK